MIYPDPGASFVIRERSIRCLRTGKEFSFMLKGYHHGLSNLLDKPGLLNRPLDPHAYVKAGAKRVTFTYISTHLGDFYCLAALIS